jgi:CheR methyltransferase, all-alpha domain
VSDMTFDGLDHLSSRDFQRLARFIQDYSGIKMPATKKTMVEGRLRMCSMTAAWIQSASP